MTKNDKPSDINWESWKPKEYIPSAKRSDTSAKIRNMVIFASIVTLLAASGIAFYINNNFVGLIPTSTPTEEIPVTETAETPAPISLNFEFRVREDGLVEFSNDSFVPKQGEEVPVFYWDFDGDNRFDEQSEDSAATQYSYTRANVRDEDDINPENNTASFNVGLYYFTQTEMVFVRKVIEVQIPEVEVPGTDLGFTQTNPAIVMQFIPAVPTAFIGDSSGPGFIVSLPVGAANPVEILLEANYGKLVAFGEGSDCSLENLANFTLQPGNLHTFIYCPPASAVGSSDIISARPVDTSQPLRAAQIEVSLRQDLVSLGFEQIINNPEPIELCTTTAEDNEDADTDPQISTILAVPLRLFLTPNEALSENLGEMSYEVLLTDNGRNGVFYQGSGADCQAQASEMRLSLSPDAKASIVIFYQAASLAEAASIELPEITARVLAGSSQNQVLLRLQAVGVVQSENDEVRFKTDLRQANNAETSEEAPIEGTILLVSQRTADEFEGGVHYEVRTLANIWMRDNFFFILVDESLIPLRPED